MTDFEMVMMCFLVPIYGVLFYTAGKCDILNLIVLMIREKTKEIEQRVKEDA